VKDEKLFVPGPPEEEERKPGRRKSSVEKLNILLIKLENRQQLLQRLLNPTLSLEETSLLLGVSKGTLRQYTNQNRLKHFRTSGGQRRFYLLDILGFLAKRDGNLGDIMQETEKAIQRAKSRLQSVGKREKRRGRPPKKKPSAEKLF